MVVKFHSINWDASPKEKKNLPNEYITEVNSDFDIDSDGADLLSDKFGYTIVCFSYKIMDKQELIKLLLDDFISMFPNASRPEKMALYSRLNLMDLKDLGLLASQIKKQN